MLFGEKELPFEVNTDCEIDDFTARCVMNPNSRKRLMWDCLGMIVLCYDLLLIPLQLTFPEEIGSSVFSIIGSVTLFYWTFDIGASFAVGYYAKDGKLIMGCKKIAYHYCTSWFGLDLIIVSVDWLTRLLNFLSGELASSGNQMVVGLGRVGKLLRGLHVLRTLKLLRLAKLRVLWHTIQDHIDSEYLSTMLNIMKYIVVIIAVNHYIACVWYAVGNSKEYEDTWVINHGFEHESTAYKYFTSLHWSLTQFTPASMSVQPHNLKERVFGVVILLFALIVFSSFLSSITSAMTCLRTMGASEERQFWLLRKYFRQHHISRELSTRIMRFVSVVVMMNRARLQKKEVTFLGLLSDPLHHELHAELFRSNLTVHPLFATLCEKYQILLGKICSTSITSLPLSRRDVVFWAEDPARCMYFVSLGEILYFPMRDVSHPIHVKSCVNAVIPESGNSDEALQSSWLCETILWTPWMHQGTGKSNMQTELLQLNPAPFRTTLLEHPVHASFAKRYALHFVDQLNQASHEISDLEENLVTREDMISMVDSDNIIRKSSKTVNNNDMLQKATGVAEKVEEKLGGVFHRLGL
jgi:hypothetical protein